VALSRSRMLHSHNGRRVKDGCIDIALVHFLGVWRNSSYQSKHRLGEVYTVGHLAGQDTAVEDSISRTGEMIFLISCSCMMYDHDMPFLSMACFRS